MLMHPCVDHMHLGTHARTDSTGTTRCQTQRAIANFAEMAAVDGSFGALLHRYDPESLAATL